MNNRKLIANNVVKIIDPVIKVTGFEIWLCLFLDIRTCPRCLIPVSRLLNEVMSEPISKAIGKG